MRCGEFMRHCRRIYVSNDYVLYHPRVAENRAAHSAARADYRGWPRAVGSPDRTGEGSAT